MIGLRTRPARPDAEGIEYLSRRHPWKIIATVVVLFVLANVVEVLLSPGWQWNVVAEYFFSPEILLGLLHTIELSFIALALGLALGLVTALMRLSDNLLLRTVSTIYVWVIRAIPVLVQLLFIYFLAALLPKLSIGIPFVVTFASVPTNDVISPFTAAILGLSIASGAYIAEIIRGGILAVPAGQVEAARALGMHEALVLRRVVLPQAMRVIIPPLGNEFVSMFKHTSIVMVIGYTELLTTAQLIYSRTYQTIPLLVVASIWYLVLTSVASYIQSLIEKRYGRGFRRA